MKRVVLRAAEVLVLPTAALVAVLVLAPGRAAIVRSVLERGRLPILLIPARAPEEAADRPHRTLATPTTSNR